MPAQHAMPVMPNMVKRYVTQFHLAGFSTCRSKRYTNDTTLLVTIIAQSWCRPTDKEKTQLYIPPAMNTLKGFRCSRLTKKIQIVRNQSQKVTIVQIRERSDEGMRRDRRKTFPRMRFLPLYRSPFALHLCLRVIHLIPKWPPF